MRVRTAELLNPDPLLATHLRLRLGAASSLRLVHANDADTAPGVGGTDLRIVLATGESARTLSLVAEASRRRPGGRLLVVTESASQHEALACLRLGASAYLEMDDIGPATLGVCLAPGTREGVAVLSRAALGSPLDEVVPPRAAPRVIVDGSSNELASDLATLLAVDRRFRLVPAPPRVLSLLQRVARAQPDLVILTSNSARVPSSAELAAIGASAPRARVAILCKDSGEAPVLGWLQAGAAAALHAGAAAVTLLDALTFAGSQPAVLLDAGIARSLRASLGDPPTTPHPPRLPPHLTPRQRAVIVLAAAAQQDQEIAAALGIETNTVRTHLRNIMHAFGVRTRIELGMRLAQFDLHPP